MSAPSLSHPGVASGRVVTNTASARWSKTGVDPKNTLPLSAEEVAQFQRDGFIIKRGCFSAAEMNALMDVATKDESLLDSALSVVDASGKESKLSLWNHPGDNIYGLFARCRRVVDAMEQVFGDEVYHYHSKMMQKEPKVGGAWEWHQDYGYWYQNGCLAPDMGSCLIAANASTKENGCLQVLAGSHLLGRVEHGKGGGQTAADDTIVQEAIKRFPLVYFEAQPGDALFFHGNLLHASSPNTSDHSRWSLICTFNTRSNDPFRESHHPNFTPLVKVDDAAILRDGTGKGSNKQDFMAAGADKTSEHTSK